MTERVQQSPSGLTATATHDTKRGEDARTRILALSELPGLWTERVAQWRRVNAALVGSANGKRTPSVGHEYMLYQTLVGAWPLAPLDESLAPRIEEYAVKAAREGKSETNWLNPDEDYEAGLREFVRAILDRARSRAFLESFEEFARRTALLGALGSLTQLVLKATIPGVPDFYQGTETWDLSLVDPDNRRPVDFAAMQAALAAHAKPDWALLAATWTEGGIKLALTRRLLSLRNMLPALFANGTYEPIEVTGPDSNRIVAFLRSAGSDRVVVVAARHFARLTDNGSHWPKPDWQAELNLDLRQRQGLRSALGDEGCRSLEVSNLLGILPVAVLRN